MLRGHGVTPPFSRGQRAISELPNLGECLTPSSRSTRLCMIMSWRRRSSSRFHSRSRFRRSSLRDLASSSSESSFRGQAAPRRMRRARLEWPRSIRHAPTRRRRESAQIRGQTTSCPLSLRGGSRASSPSRPGKTRGGSAARASRPTTPRPRPCGRTIRSRPDAKPCPRASRA